ncbi:hypothetical protein Desgi_2261 [Desulfoscipio gibsoniae DSM 7213]|uniref:Uncharacterized protein n=1 Tax=Desulfoscipio gibsoniae DSM 7213 TaxID=767817 RepID=R4KPV7_9FIRM|nr:hypothetical protein Desgi_2261 [Desulfoscipio gibsoniae DSM 7213]
MDIEALSIIKSMNRGLNIKRNILMLMIFPGVT